MHSTPKIPKALVALYFLLILQTLLILGAFVYTVQTSEEIRFGGDFVTFWLRGQALIEGDLSRIYDMAVFDYVLPQNEDAHHIYTVFPYPPSFLLYLWPLGYFSQPVAMGIWLLVTGFLYAYAIFHSQEWHRFKRSEPPQRNLLAIFICTSPFVLSNILTAQTGFLTGALLIAGLVLLDKRPWLAGICIGLLSFKPQLGIMLPFALLAGHYYRTFLSAALTAIAMVIASCYLWGINLWLEYPAYLSKFGELVMHVPEMLIGLYCSFFHYARQVMPLPLAFAGQGVLIGIAICTVCRAFSSYTHKEYRNSILICATFVAAPHTMAYDMTVFIVPVLYITHLACQGRVSVASIIPFLLLVTLLPFNLNKFNLIGIPAGVIVVTLLFLSLIPHLKGGQKR